MIKKLVCFDDDSIKNLEIVQGALGKNRSASIRQILAEKVRDIAKNNASFVQQGDLLKPSEDIPKKVSVEGVLIEK